MSPTHNEGEVVVNPVQHLVETAEMLNIPQVPIQLLRDLLEAQTGARQDPMNLLQIHGLLRK